MTRIAVVGLGGWGPNLLRNASQLAGARVSVLCDTDAARLTSVGALYPDCERTSDPETVFDRKDVDAVVLATPAAAHAPQALRALRAGKHVFVEKPLALSVADGEAVVDEARRCGRTLMCGHTFLYNDAVMKLKELVDAGELGRVYFVNAERLSLGKIRDDVNAMWNLSPHDFSILLYLFGGMPSRVWAHGGKFLPGSRLHDVVLATLEFSSGAIAHVQSSWLNPLKVRRMTVVGEKRMLLYDDVSETRRIVVFDKSVDSRPFDDPSGSFAQFRHHIRTGGESVPDFEFREPLALEMQHFADCIREGKTPRTDGAEALRVLRVLAACQQSLESDGCPVRLDGASSGV